MESVSKLSNINFEWTKTLYQNILGILFYTFHFVKKAFDCCLVPWVPEVFLTCSGNFQCWLKADTSSALRSL